MNNISDNTGDEIFQRRALEAAIRIGLVLLVVLWCFYIVRPFILPVLWGAIIAVAIYPLYLKLGALLAGRRKTAAALITLVGLALLIVPSVMLTESTIQNSQSIAQQLQDGTVNIPPPSEKVRDWPLVGEKLYGAWELGATNLGAAVSKYRSQLEGLGKHALAAAANAGATVLQFILSIIIAGILLVYADSSCRGLGAIASRIMGASGGKSFVEMAGATIRSVAQGVLGIAVIQAVLGGIGLLVMGVPYAGVWTLLILLLAIVQLPPLLVLGPIIVYVFTTSATVPAVIFMIWSLLVSMSDSFLKPLLLGRGMDIPTLVILLGAIGGMLLSGIIGLFVGAVVLAVSYTLFKAWLEQMENMEPEATDAE